MPADDAKSRNRVGLALVMKCRVILPSQTCIYFNSQTDTFFEICPWNNFFHICSTGQHGALTANEARNTGRLSQYRS